MKLYYSPGACSLAPHIVLDELGHDYELERVDLAAKTTESGSDFCNINAKGYVPTLEIAKDTVLTEVAVILQYLADTAEDARLLPRAGTMERYRALEILNFIASELHKGIGSLFNPAMPADGKRAIVARLEPRLAWLDNLLAGRPYLLGDSFSVADAYAFTVLGWSRWVDLDLSRYAHITAFMDRVAARPAVRSAMRSEGLIGN